MGKACLRCLRITSVATIGWRGSDLSRMALIYRCAGQLNNTARAGWGCSSARVPQGLLSTELAYRNRDPISGALPPGLHYAETHNMYLAGQFRQGLVRYDRARQASFRLRVRRAPRFLQRRLAPSRSGLIDAALVGGVDTLCLTTLYGFGSLELLSTEVCRPYDESRSGISIAEAAGFALLERVPAASRANQLSPDLYLLGFGESSDAHHMSSPHPGRTGRAAGDATGVA